MKNLYQLNKIIVTPLKKIFVNKGNVLHAIKKGDKGFNSFGEAYFSNINYKSIKAWKKHKQMTMNFIVPCGKVKFVIYDEKNNIFYDEIIGERFYKRLTIKKNIWFGFMGMSRKQSIILNVIDTIHNPRESIQMKLKKLKYRW